MAKIMGKTIKHVARFFWAISNKLFFISAKLLKEKIACYETKTCYSHEPTELVIEWERVSDDRK